MVGACISAADAVEVAAKLPRVAESRSRAKILAIGCPRSEFVRWSYPNRDPGSDADCDKIHDYNDNVGVHRRCCRAAISAMIEVPGRLAIYFTVPASAALRRHSRHRQSSPSTGIGSFAASSAHQQVPERSHANSVPQRAQARRRGSGGGISFGFVMITVEASP